MHIPGKNRRVGDINAGDNITVIVAFLQAVTTLEQTYG